MSDWIQTLDSVQFIGEANFHISGWTSESFTLEGVLDAFDEILVVVEAIPINRGSSFSENSFKAIKTSYLLNIIEDVGITCLNLNSQTRRVLDINPSSNMETGDITLNIGCSEYTEPITEVLCNIKAYGLY